MKRLSKRERYKAAAQELSPVQFKAELIRLSKRFGLTAGDLAIWFDRPRPTVQVWLWRPFRPRRGTVFDELVRRIKLLVLSTAFPVPYEVGSRTRRAYVAAARDHALNGGVSTGNFADGWTVLQGRDQYGRPKTELLRDPDGAIRCTVKPYLKPELFSVNIESLKNRKPDFDK